MNILIVVLIAILCWMVIGKLIITIINHPNFSPIIIIELMYFLLLVGYATK